MLKLSRQSVYLALLLFSFIAYSKPIIYVNQIGFDTKGSKISSIVHYYNKQRANTPEELNTDKNMLLYGSTKKVDVHGGWCDASGDVSKYFSHLAYANFVSPQQIPLVTWSLVNTSETIPKELKE